jgi:hypothetical protein
MMLSYAVSIIWVMGVEMLRGLVPLLTMRSIIGVSVSIAWFCFLYNLDPPRRENSKESCVTISVMGTVDLRQKHAYVKRWFYH